MHIKTETRVGIFVLAALLVFVYMTFRIGVFRLDRANYHRYYVTFKDVSGLSKKADVKIAGVKVGWVDKVDLVEEGTLVQATIMVLKEYIVHKDAYAVVRQDGLLGNKYLEVVPGDPGVPMIPAGGRLGKPGRDQASFDDILNQVKVIADNIQDVTSSFKNVLGGAEGSDRLSKTIEYVSDAAVKMASFAQSLERFMSSNEHNMHDIVEDTRIFIRDLKDKLPLISDDFHQLSGQLSQDVLPALRAGIDKISSVVDRDFNRMTSKLETTADSLDEAAIQVRDGFRNVNDVAVKINEGRGLIGKLINEDGTYHDLKVAIGGLKNYFAKLDTVGVVIDAWGESMQRATEGFTFQNAKGYFNIRIHPNEDHFYLVGLVGSTIGVIDRQVWLRRWFDGRGCELIPIELNLSNRDKLKFAPEKDYIIRKLDSYTLNAQFAKTFDNLAIRFGIFESTAGIGIDYSIPFNCDTFRWIMTFEAFDFRGRQRVDDDRSHLKWLNKMFVTRNIYFAFGADDFISKNNKNAFFGFGIRFADDDLKYLLAKVNINV